MSPSAALWSEESLTSPSVDSHSPGGYEAPEAPGDRTTSRRLSFPGLRLASCCSPTLVVPDETPVQPICRAFATKLDSKRIPGAQDDSSWRPRHSPYCPAHVLPPHPFGGRLARLASPRARPHGGLAHGAVPDRGSARGGQDQAGSGGRPRPAPARRGGPRRGRLSDVAADAPVGHGGGPAGPSAAARRPR